MKKTIAIIGTAIAVACSSSRAQVQTLVVSPQTTNSAVVNVNSNSYAVINSADTDDGGQLLLSVQGVSFVKDFSDTSVAGLTVAGPATIQLGSGCCSPINSYLTFDVVHQSAHIPIQTLVATPQNTNSAIMTVNANSYAIVKSADYDDGGLLLLNMQGVNFVKDFSFESINNLTIVGPATIQLQAHCCDFVATYVTVQVVHDRIKTIP